MNTLRFTKGMAAAPCRLRRSPDRASDGGSEGTALADPKSQLAFPPRSASRNEEMEKGLASAFVIRWPICPSGPRRE
jgi:hypothetical protein